MASPITITLNANMVLVEAHSDTLVSVVSEVAIGQIIQIGDGVSEWAVEDVIVYKNNSTGRFKTSEGTFTAIPQEDIYFSYEAAALP